MREPPLAEIAVRTGSADLILAEGLWREPVPKVQFSRAELGAELIANANELIAVASDRPMALGVPCFDLDDAAGIAAFIEEKLLFGF